MTEHELKKLISESCQNALLHYEKEVNTLYETYKENDLAVYAFPQAIIDSLPIFIEKALYEVLKQVISLDGD